MVDAYRRAGVDLEAGYEVVSRIKKHVRRTTRPGALGSVGGFGGLFDLSSLGLKEPVLVSGTDGVGTKLMVALRVDKHDTVGIDAVAMCVNDIVVQGAEPLFFLDYIACGKLHPARVEAIVQGVSEGCVQAGCALIGGETAEMPGLYLPHEYDLAGFAVGACEKADLIDGSAIRAGDVLIGLASSGLHSNGYSLVRRILFAQAKLHTSDHIEELGCTIGEELLRPTRIYVKPILNALKRLKLKGMAHITGGGFLENIPRMLPAGLGAVIEEGCWEVPPIFPFLESLGEVERLEMYNVFNMGIGLVIAVDEELAGDVLRCFTELGERAYAIGRVVEGEGVQIT
ncbi:MAG: phosphoribosylformylglycinamidine cyclo-ligase [Limnochordia bacterium]